MNFDVLWQGTAEVLSLSNFVMLFGGTCVGIIFGALPGLTATMGLALLLPFTFTMSASMGLITLAGIYIGALYGGAIPALLINTPGTPSAIATTFDGYPLTQKGEPQKGLVAAAVASFIGTALAVVVLATSAEPLAKLAIKFGQAEYFWLSVFGLTIIASLSGDSLVKALLAGMVGVIFSFVGLSPVTGEVRMTYGIIDLQSGINLAAFLVGLFCLPEVLGNITGESNKNISAQKVEPNVQVVFETVKEIFLKPMLLLRSSIIGCVIGFIPGSGGNIAGIISYNEAKRWSKTPEEYGTGIIDGVIASEAANSATAPSSAIPMLTLGIPGSPPAAMMIGAMMLHGMKPGPELFSEHATVTFAFIMALFFAALVVMVVGSFGSVIFSHLINVSMVRLAPVIILLTLVGSYAIQNSVWDMWVMLFFGLFGYIAQKLEFPAAPLILGFILAPYAEEGLAISILIGSSQGSVFLYLIQSMISKVLIALSIFSAVWPLVSSLLIKKNKGVTP